MIVTLVFVSDARPAPADLQRLNAKMILIRSANSPQEFQERSIPAVDSQRRPSACSSGNTGTASTYQDQPKTAERGSEETFNP
jgi:hypothetical protein